MARGEHSAAESSSTVLSLWLGSMMCCSSVCICMDVQVLYECKRNRSELLAEAVPEALKNVLLVMAAQGVLAPSWTVSP